MGKSRKQQPGRLPDKLQSVRSFLKLSQQDMIKLVKPESADPRKSRTYISEFENGRRVPSLLEVYNYAKAVRDLSEFKDFTSDDLINDEKELPWIS